MLTLRPVFVLYPEMEPEVKARAADPVNYRGPSAGGPNAAGGGPVWHYVDPRDAARAFRLGLEAETGPFATYFVSGKTTMAPQPTLTRLAGYLGYETEVRDASVYERNLFAPLYDLEAPRRDLGYEPQQDLRPLLYGGAGR